MASIRITDSPLHFCAAVGLFMSLGVSEITEMTVQRRMGGHPCLHIWNICFSVGGLLFFGLWLIIAEIMHKRSGSYFEWIAATMPFLYFLPWPYQAWAYTSKMRQETLVCDDGLSPTLEM